MQRPLLAAASNSDARSEFLDTPFRDILKVYLPGQDLIARQNAVLQYGGKVLQVRQVPQILDVGRVAVKSLPVAFDDQVAKAIARRESAQTVSQAVSIERHVKAFFEWLHLDDGAPTKVYVTDPITGREHRLTSTKDLSGHYR